MDFTDLKNRISRPATCFTVGGFRPTNALEEPWIGRVNLCLPGERVPIDPDGLPLLPLAQFFLPALPYIPDCLTETKLLTVFISGRLPDQFESMGERWLVREYADIDDLVSCDTRVDQSQIKAFPMSCRLFEADFPIWDGGGLSCDDEKEIIELQRTGKIESYYDLTEHSYDHKFGGFPSFCQPGVDFGDGFEFAFQISSDNKARLNVVDSGSLMFAKNPSTSEWKIYYDFY